MLVDHCLSICQRLMELMSFSGRKKKQTSDEGLLAGFHQSDPEQNSEFTPPAEEEIELCCIWATENLYACSYGKPDRSVAQL